MGKKVGKNSYPLSQKPVFMRFFVNFGVLGYRALLVKVAQEKLGFPFEVADRQLAHSVGDNTRKAYDRGVFWDQRVALMQAWGDYVEDQCRGLDGGLFAYKAFLKDPK